jgi:hypothetical protein
LRHDRPQCLRSRVIPSKELLNRRTHDSPERPIFDRFVRPGDHERLAEYGTAGEYADRVLGVFRTVVAAPDAPGSEEVAETFVRLAEMPAAEQ